MALELQGDPMRSAAHVFTFLLLASTLRANAQQPPLVETGQRVRLSYDCRTRTLSTGAAQTNCRRTSGTVTALRADTLILTVGKLTASHPLSAVTRLEVSRGRKSKWLTGAAIGAPVGALAGVGILTLANGQWVCGDYEVGGLCWVVVGAGTIGGGLLGALVGAIAKTERWEEASLNRLRVTILPQGHRFGVRAALHF